MNLPDVLAAIGLAQIRKYNDELLQARKRVYDYYNDFFLQQKWALVPPFVQDGCAPSYHLYPLRIDGITEAQRDTIIELITETGVAVNVHFLPLPMLTIFKEKGLDIKNYPTTYRLYAAEISLPIYPQLGDKECSYIVSSVAEAVKKVINHG
jgi:dTDP-4-amino-4,6-dideoxygalactose transaminase